MVRLKEFISDYAANNKLAFQFLMVRLKAKILRFSQNLTYKFQFLMVRLKEGYKYNAKKH